MKRTLNLFLLTFLFSSQAYGLLPISKPYLYCVNPTVNPEQRKIEGTGWNWAKGNDDNNRLTDYSEYVKVVSNGIQLKGNYLNIPNANYFTLSKPFETIYEEYSFCEAISRKCQDDFDPNFVGIGVYGGSYSIAKSIAGYSSWYNIVFYRNSYDKIKNEMQKIYDTCANIKFKLLETSPENIFQNEVID
ncbi:hypothetical protein [Silvanigrella aquatica]|uniref:Uncharacterized protein n=1 Tax=Silvanigrella aquatica TaxID=1915309 RepID=A0A1L4D3D8_9BACT|nr:hypothetical protein [Silvanigrella aquatica]APJ04715.1 hypothetical protein AXG55_12710 [Silvanigrella aquatica]